MDKILHDPKDPKLWELWYIPIMGNAGFCPSAVRITYTILGFLITFCSIMGLQNPSLIIKAPILRFLLQGTNPKSDGDGFRASDRLGLGIAVGLGISGWSLLNTPTYSRHSGCTNLN